MFASLDFKNSLSGREYLIIGLYYIFPFTIYFNISPLYLSVLRHHFQECSSWNRLNYMTLRSARLPIVIAVYLYGVPVIVLRDLGILTQSFQQVYEMVTIEISIMQMRKLKYRRVNLPKDTQQVSGRKETQTVKPMYLTPVYYGPNFLQMLWS